MSNKEVVEANDQKLKQYADELNQLQSGVESNNALSIKHGKLTLEFALKAGAILCEVKKIAPFGDWLKWLEENVKGIKERTAQNYMKLAEEAAKPQHVAFFQEAESLREAYLRFGITKTTKTKAESKNSDGEMTPEKMKEKDAAQYKTKLDAARQEASTSVRQKIDGTDRVNWSLSKWTVKNNKPCSGDKTNSGAVLFNALGVWVAKRDYSSLTYEDEVSMKAGVVLVEVLNTIILANTPPGTQPGADATLKDYGHVSMTINPEPAMEPELAPA